MIGDSCRFVVLLILTFSLSHVVRSLDAFGWYFDLQFLRRASFSLSIDYAGEDVVFSLNTYELHNAAKLQPDCSDLIFLHMTPLENVTLSWWPETLCPGSVSQPETNIWLRVPMSFDPTNGSSILIFYGTSESYLQPVNIGRLFWTNSREIHLFEGECPLEYSERTEWEDAFVAGASDGSSCCSEVKSGRHTHTIHPVLINCDIIECTLIPDEVCAGSSGVTDPTHGHVIDSVALDETELSPSSILPPYFSLQPCFLNNQNQGIGYLSPIISSGSSSTAVGLFVSDPVNGDWCHYLNSTSRFLRLGAAGQGGPVSDHFHPYECGPLCSSYVTDDESRVYVAETGSDTCISEVHSHLIQNISILSTFVGSMTPPHAWGHFFSLVGQGDGSLDLGMNGTRLFFFDGDLPPIGYGIVQSSIGRLIQGFGFGEAQRGFEAGFDPPPHQHPFDEVETVTEWDGGGTGAPVDRQNDCGTPVQTYGKAIQPSTPHRHFCRGSTAGGGSNMPDRVEVVIGYRFQTQIIDLWGNEEIWVPAKGFSLLVYVGIGVVVVGVVLAVLILVFFVVLCCCRARKTEPSLLSFGEDIDLLDDVEGKSAMVRIQKDLFIVEMKDIQLLEVIGRGGGAAVVYRAQWAGKTIAYKAFTSPLFGSDGFEAFEKEVGLAASLKHPSIVEFFGCCLDKRLGILMEFCSFHFSAHGCLIFPGALGDMDSFIRRKRMEESPIAFGKKLAMLLDVSHGMAYLHSRKIIHRDLKPGNVLLTVQLQAKLMDFGISRLVDAESRMTRRLGTPIYMAPEIVLGSVNYSLPVDVYSFGITAYQILLEVWHPFGLRREMCGSIEFQIANDPSFRPDMGIASSLSGRLKTLIVSCWQSESEKRPTFTEIVETLEEEMEEIGEDATLEKM